MISINLYSKHPNLSWCYYKCNSPQDDDCDMVCDNCLYAEIDHEQNEKVRKLNEEVDKFYERIEMLRITVLQKLINVFETYRCKYSVENSDGFQAIAVCDNVYFVFNGEDLYIDGNKLEYGTLQMKVESEDNVIHITFDDDINEVVEVNIYDRRG